ncbi:hypothetical protein [Azospirillum ramasamyi]|uniref:Uncharacterized protein n=1 Tax=Azospirillum ramasamyi TaxID=682998 RepID=A0A2U9S8C1_9PROT|nr:hypothetical protein [Azospirillum ramasamyi]AWU95652.1 hypothetical protein DM194_15255 [Azospirillum ramasamyi]
MTRDEAIDIVAKATAQVTWQQTRAVGVLVAPVAAWDDPDVRFPVVIVGAEAALDGTLAQRLLDDVAGEARSEWAGTACLAKTVHRLLGEGWSWAWEAPLDSPAYLPWRAGNLASVGARRHQTPAG